MNSQKNIVIMLALIVAFGAGIIVGGYVLPENVRITSEGVITGNNTDQASNTQNVSETAEQPSAVLTESTTVDTSQLSEGQKTLLNAMGIDADTLVITPEMAACAEAKVGAERLKEIMDGATPSFTEGAGLYACYK